jgi:hypothetical protein
MFSESSKSNRGTSFYLDKPFRSREFSDIDTFINELIINVVKVLKADKFGAAFTTGYTSDNFDHYSIARCVVPSRYRTVHATSYSTDNLFFLEVYFPIRTSPPYWRPDHLDQVDEKLIPLHSLVYRFSNSYGYYKKSLKSAHPDRTRKSKSLNLKVPIARVFSLHPDRWHLTIDPRDHDSFHAFKEIIEFHRPSFTQHFNYYYNNLSLEDRTYYEQIRSQELAKAI